jgi:hypothetical protein
MRVWSPICSAASWSIEIEFRKPGAPAPGAPVRKLAGGWCAEAGLIPGARGPRRS